jgi:hypothetical protein
MPGRFRRGWSQAKSRPAKGFWMAWGNTVKCAWSDKFRMPSLDELRSGLPKPLQQVFDDARHRLSYLDGVTESLVWQGVPWRWTLVYVGGGSGTSEGRPSVYLVPDPQRIQICVPLCKDQIEHLPLKRMKKSIRDGVVFARSVAGVWWPTWDVPTVGALDEVFELVTRKHKLLSGADAGTPVEA